jgi:hypothetical protein
MKHVGDTHPKLGARFIGLQKLGWRIRAGEARGICFNGEGGWRGATRTTGWPRYDGKVGSAVAGRPTTTASLQVRRAW